MTNINEDYSDYVGVGHNQPTDLLEVTKLAEAQLAAQKKVEVLEEGLKLAKEELRQIAEKKLPEEMERLGLSSFRTKSNAAIEIIEKIRASLAVENRPKGFAWLEENGYGGMIKSEVVVPFLRNELEDAHQLVDDLRADQFMANLERKVEPMTLTAFVKEQLANGRDIPLDIFGVFRQRIAKVEM